MNTKYGSEAELLGEIRKLAGREFVYEDGWCGMVPFDGKLGDMQTGPPVAFAELHWREQADVLREFIHWESYPVRDWNDEYIIKDNIAAGKQPEQWLDGTSLHESFRLIAEGQTPRPRKESPEITEQDLRSLFAAARPHPQAKDGNAADRAAAAKAFQDIFRDDPPRQAKSKTQEWSGWEI
jgi:hypothetical protein